MVMSLKLSMLITNDDDHDDHDDDVFLAGWGSFEASNSDFSIFRLKELHVSMFDAIFLNIL